MNKIFKPQNNKQEDKVFIGAYVPRYMNESLNLLALSKMKSRTEILQNILKSSIENNTLDNDIGVIYERIAARAYIVYENDLKNKKMKRRFKSFDDFLMYCTSELKKKKLSDMHISEIMKSLQLIIKSKEIQLEGTDAKE